MEFPEILKPFADDLLATRQESLLIGVKEDKTEPLQSKFGGNPYWLKDEPFPVGIDGEPLLLLAQINFAEIETPLKHFPTIGILQFFASPGTFFGMNLDNMTQQDNFRVVYHETIEQDESKWLTAIPLPSDGYFPVEAELSLSFYNKEELVSQADFRFWEIVDTPEDNWELRHEIQETYFEDFYHGQEHKIGGYPYFTQDDPRLYSGYPDHLIQLLQMDTDDSGTKPIIRWGDLGAGHFFITEEDLKRRDFSNVVYYWDCF